MDKFMSTISDLKSDNERLKQDNIDLKQQVTAMEQKLEITATNHGAIILNFMAYQELSMNNGLLQNKN
ncbi:hypothetical protein DPMN_091296 [Dreissena polymorpha]|uniref:Uncharacterized protein n=1 Tax=Dreissena polymorpha TaxID=45954 RepID=A0A9D4QZW2_DREPO|nr:hypothetical protein DPMN_091296 [Dreissena polymorpha]